MDSFEELKRPPSIAPFALVGNLLDGDKPTSEARFRGDMIWLGICLDGDKPTSEACATDGLAAIWACPGGVNIQNQTRIRRLILTNIFNRESTPMDANIRVGIRVYSS